MKQSRRTRGFSLVSVVITASLTAMFLAASAATIVPLFRSIGSSQSEVLMTSVAESATDYVIGLLNDSSTRSEVDCDSTYGSSKRVNDDLPLIASMFGAPSELTVEVWVRNVAPLPVASTGTGRSLAYDPLISPHGDPGLPDSLKNASEKWGKFKGVGMNPWRVIECRVKYGGREKLLLTSLRPVYVAEPVSATQPTFNSLFEDSRGIGLSSIYLGTNSFTKGYESADSTKSFIDAAKVDPYTLQSVALGGDISSFGRIELSPGSSVGGNLQILKDSGNSVGSTLNVGSGAVVTQALQVSGTSQNYSYDPTLYSNGNVYNASNTDFPAVSESAVLNGEPPISKGVSPVPSAPPTAQTVGDLSVSSGAQTISAGDYVATSLTVESGSSLSSSSPSLPVRVFLNDSGNRDSVVSIKGDVNSSGNPSALQIYYPGSGTISIQGSGNRTVNAVIYAPNARVSLGSNVRMNFSGAILARSIAGSFDSAVPTSGINNTTLNLDYSLGQSPSSSNSSVASVSFDPSKLNAARMKLRAHSVLEPFNAKDSKYSH